MRSVKPTEIRIDGKTQSRTMIDQQLVQHYQECMTAGDVFPPLDTVFDGSSYWLYDGFHRYHALMLSGAKTIDLNYKAGTIEDAQVLSFGVNSKHGKSRTNEDKAKAVSDALVHSLTKDKTDYAIAIICAVSQPFVASIRSPEKKAKQSEARDKSANKKSILENESSKNNVIDLDVTTNPISIYGENKGSGLAPSDEELRANELSMAADLEALNILLESDDALATAHTEIKRLNLENARLDIRLKGLMAEKNEAVKMVKKLQKENEKLRNQK